MVRDYTGRLLLMARFNYSHLEVKERRTKSSMGGYSFVEAALFWQTIWLEGDAHSVIQKLKSRHSTVDCSAPLQDERRMLSVMKVFEISLMYRKGNQCADWVMKWCRECDTEVAKFDGFSLESRSRCRRLLHWSTITLGPKKTPPQAKALSLLFLIIQRELQPRNYYIYGIQSYN